MEFEEYQNSLFYSKKGYHTYIGREHLYWFTFFSLKIVEMLKGYKLELGQTFHQVSHLMSMVDA